MRPGSCCICITRNKSFTDLDKYQDKNKPKNVKCNLKGIKIEEIIEAVYLCEQYVDMEKNSIHYWFKHIFIYDWTTVTELYQVLMGAFIIYDYVNLKIY